jgi:hypothetical protein
MWKRNLNTVDDQKVISDRITFESNNFLTSIFHLSNNPQSIHVFVLELAWEY